MQQQPIDKAVFSYTDDKLRNIIYLLREINTQKEMQKSMP